MSITGCLDFTCFIVTCFHPVISCKLSLKLILLILFLFFGCKINRFVSIMEAILAGILYTWPHVISE